MPVIWWPNAGCSSSGRRLAVGEVTIRSDGIDDPVAHATSTYSIPGSN
jgi:acyl-coenzyme A thioesterase PaaI-like protein